MKKPALPSRPRRLPLPRRPLAPATKRTATVGKGVVQSTVSGNGTLEPTQKVEPSFGASGAKVTAIRVKAGQKVSKGEVLAEVDSSSARASLASAEAPLIEAEESVKAAEEGEECEEVAYTGSAHTVAYIGSAHTVFVGLMSEDGTGAAKADEAEKQAAAEKEAANQEGASPEAETTAPTESGSTTPAASGAESGGSESAGGATVSLPTAEANLRGRTECQVGPPGSPRNDLDRSVQRHDRLDLGVGR